jgi:uncharacterized protein (DUF362 family)
MSVSVLKANLSNIDKKVKEALELIHYKPKKKRLFFKPNIVGPFSPRTGVVTHFRVVEALIKYFWGYEMIVGEGVAIGSDFKSSIEVSGYRKLCKKYDIPIVNLDYCERFDVNWKYGVLSLPKVLEEYEYIDVPTMKTHKQTTVSLGIKNQKGLLAPLQKRWFHYEGLEQLSSLIKELQTVVSPALTVVDGILCLEGEGPVDFGKPKKAELLVAGEDVVEVDNVCSRLMGIDPKQVAHIPYREKVEVLGVPIDKAKMNFIPAKTDYYNVYNIFYQSNYSCSGCLYATKNALAYFYRNPVKFIKFICGGKMELISGRKPRLPTKADKVICLGDCCERFAQEHNLAHLKGCPPDSKDIFDKLC